MKNRDWEVYKEGTSKIFFAGSAIILARNVHSLLT